jgi:hypothetical protein
MSAWDLCGTNRKVRETKLELSLVVIACFQALLLEAISFEELDVAGGASPYEKPLLAKKGKCPETFREGHSVPGQNEENLSRVTGDNDGVP